MIDSDKYGCPDDSRLLQDRRAQYFGLIKEVDDNLGRLFDFLKQTGQWDNTLIMFTSDHGEQMGDHWLMSKLGFYDQSAHVPLIIRDPSDQADATRGTLRDSLTENVDLMPTMLEWLGLPVPSQCDGHSLMPQLRSEAASTHWRDAVHWEYDFRDALHQRPERALAIASHQCTLSVLRDTKYKYVHFAALPPLLFDLQQDPDEMINVAHDPEYRDVITTYAQKLLSHRMTYASRGLTELTLTAEGVVRRDRA